MAVKPKIKTLTNSSVDVLNAIRNNASINYQNYVPQATADSESIKEIGAVIMDNPNLQNEFLNALVNRIGRVLLTSKTYDNPWAMFKQGYLEFGESVEEIFVNLAKPYQFDTDVAENEVFKKEIPDVRAAFHIMNYQKFYKATVTQEQLRQAFLSWDGVTSLIAKIVDAMYTGANYDEFQTMKYMLARRILKGQIKPVEISAVSTANMKDIVSTIKGVSNKLTFMSDEYNLAGVMSHTPKDEQYLLVNAEFESKMNVEVLASAFNMDKAEFAGHMVLVDGFGELDIARLNTLFADDSTYVEIGTSELQALNEIPAILIDKDWFMIFDNLQNFTEQYNGQGLYWNYFYHVWKTFSVSPFKNNVLFVPDEPSVTSVEVSPSTATVNAGQELALSVEVETENFAPQDVDWLVTTGSAYATVNKAGIVQIAENAPNGLSVTVKATSVFDSTKYDDMTITVSSNNAVSSVAVAVSSATATAGSAVQATATVTKTGSASSDVVWSLTGDSPKGTINQSGLVIVSSSAVAGNTITVRATSKYDSSKYGEVTISVVSA